MWTSKGRSGYGDSTLGGDYDSWDGISPNGRQYKNEATMETRDLSGADYWHLRKQNRPTETIPAELHMLKNGKANINAYAEPEKAVKPTSKVSIKHRILPQVARVEKLTTQMQELCQAYKAGEMDIKEYSMLLAVISQKRDRAVELLDKAKGLPTKPKNQDESRLFYGKKQASSNVSLEDDATHSLDNTSSQSIVNRVIGFVVLSAVGCMSMMWLAS